MLASLRRAWARLVNVVRPAAAEDELRREIDAHLALMAADLEAQGLAPRDAALAARRRFGAVERARGLQRDTRSFPWLDDARQDLGAALRLATRRPIATIFAILVTGVVIGATTTLFSLVYGVVLRPLPWPEPERLIRLEERRGGERGRLPWTISNATYLAWRERHDTVEDVGGWRTNGRSSVVTVGDDTDRLPVAALTPSLLRLLRTGPALGRGFVDSDAAPGAPATIVLSHGLWQRFFGGGADVIGQTLRLDGTPHTVIGVMADGFAFPDHTVQAWVPMPVMPVLDDKGVRRVMIFGALARLRPGVAPEQAASEATSAARHTPDLAQAALALFGNNGEIAIRAGGARDVQVREARGGLLLLLGALGMLGGAGLASLITLQLARTAERRREMAVRAALGAGTARLARQWIAESALLGGAATAVGLAVAAMAHVVLPHLLPAGFPRQSEVTLDATVGLVTCAVVVLASIACGMVPGWLARRDALAEVLAQDALAPVGMSLRVPAGRARLALMALQVAIACVLLVGTALLGRSVEHLRREDRGYDPRNLLTARLPLPPGQKASPSASWVAALEARLVALPGVLGAGVSNALPFVSSGGFRGLTIPSPTDPSRTIDIQTAIRVVTPEFVAAVGLRLRDGRLLSSGDRATTHPVVMVNRTFAAQYLGAAPVGQTMALNIAHRERWEVVGVVEDMRQDGLAESPTTVTAAGGPLPELFVPYAQFSDPLPELIVAVRTSGDPAAIAAPFREVIRESSPGLVADSVMSMDDRISASVALPRLYATVVAVLAGVALAVAGLGLFGVLAHTTAQRTREIGVRTALGATAADVLGLVARTTALSLIAGVAAGLSAAAALSGMLRAQVHGVSTSDPFSFVSAAGAVLGVAVVAGLVPLRRALRVDPLTALRSS